jgi:hypothetical protein
MPIAAGTVHGKCVHCERWLGLTASGLCPGCSARMTDRPPPPFATEHPPGSVAKVELMRWRAERGFAVLHPGDATEDSRPFGESRFVRYHSRGERDPREFKSHLRAG